jgi:type I restriction enzyme S subunit
MANITFPLPAKLVQTAIVSHLDRVVRRIDESMALITSSIERLAEFRSALITAAVTGQIDVATWGKRGETDRRLDLIEEEMSLQVARA